MSTRREVLQAASLSVFASQVACATPKKGSPSASDHAFGLAASRALVHAQAPTLWLTVDLFAPASAVVVPRSPINLVIVVGTDVPQPALGAVSTALERELRTLTSVDRVAMIDSGPEGELRQGRGSELATDEAIERLVSRVRALRPCASAANGAMFDMGLGLAAKTSDGAPRTRVVWCAPKGPTAADVDLERLGRALDAAKKYGFDLIVVPMAGEVNDRSFDAVVRRAGGRRSSSFPSLTAPTPPLVLLEPRVTFEAAAGVAFGGSPGRTLVLACDDLFAGGWSTQAVAVSVSVTGSAGARTVAQATFEARRPDGTSVVERTTSSVEVVG